LHPHPAGGPAAHALVEGRLGHRDRTAACAAAGTAAVPPSASSEPRAAPAVAVLMLTMAEEDDSESAATRAGVLGQLGRPLPQPDPCPALTPRERELGVAGRAASGAQGSQQQVGQMVGDLL
jgi:hypothetical protein